MKLLEERIIQTGRIINNEILKVDNFLNHQIDVNLINEIGKDIASIYPNANKVVTIETSGIAIAYATSLALNNCPLVFAKKQASKITSNNNYTAKVKSFTKGVTYDISIDKSYLNKGDKIVIVDDFLANGNAGVGLVELIRQSDAEILGFASAIEKGFQGGRENIERLGIKVYSCAIIKAFKDNKPVF